MRIFAMVALVVFLTAGMAFAVTVNLTDGRTVQGDIIKQDKKSLQMTVDGITMTYYADEVKDIDGKSFAEAQAQPAAEPAAPIVQPAPADQAEASGQTETAAKPADTTVAAPAEGTIDADKKDLIMKFIDVFGTRQALINNFDTMLKQIEKEKPEEAKKIRDRVKIDEIIERLLPIYDRNFTSEDLKSFIAFYGSPEGQKLIGTIPELMKESVQESVKYMKEKFPEVNGG